MKQRQRILLFAAAGAAVLGYFAAASALDGTADAAAAGVNAPFGRFLHGVPGFFGRAWASVSGGASAAAERDRLREENEALRADRLEAERLREENAALRRDLGLASALPGLLCAEVLSRGGSTGWRCVVRIGRGSRDGVAEGDAVVCPLGLVGRVIATSARTADVLLLSDGDSRVACRIETAGGVPVRGILSGGGIAADDRELELAQVAAPFTVEFLDKDASIRPGDRVLTSGLGASFPAGIPVGTVVSAEPDATRLHQRVAVAPLVDFGALRRVFVLRAGVPAAAAGEGDAP